MKYLPDFVEFVVEREAVRHRKEAGEDFPWTDDPVLQYFRFGNIWREDDTRTAWFHQHIRRHVDTERAVLACIVYRWFNSIPSGKILMPFLLGDEAWNERRILQQLMQLGPAKEPPVHPAAVLLALIRPFTRLAPQMGRNAESLEFGLRHMQDELCQFDTMPPRLAYEVVSDLRHTCVLDQADDLETWALAGPMACRGMGWVLTDDENEYVHGTDRTRRDMLPLMRDLLDLSTGWFDRPWEMREVETALSEFAHYRVAQVGGRSQRKYQIPV